MREQDLRQFETKLRRILEDRTGFRPFVCDGSPLDCSVFLVGANPATEMGDPFWAYWDSRRGFDKAAWFEAYKHERLVQPLKPGKTRRNPVSNTRKRLDWLAEEAAPCRCLETNIFSTPSQELKELSQEHRLTEVFDFLLAEIKPNTLVFHGQDARDHAEQHLRVHLPLDTWTEASIQGQRVQALAVPHFARGWSEERTRDLGRAVRRRCLPLSRA